MSIDIDWEALTGGSDGQELAESIRLFVHEKFQQVTLPRFIRSVNVHSFDFGTASPTIELKDICDPLADFYEEDDEDESDEDGESVQDDATVAPTESTRAFESIPSGTLNDPHRRKIQENTASHRPGDSSSMQRPHLAHLDTRLSTSHMAPGTADRSTTPMPMGTLTPGIPGGTSNLSYFHLPLGAGLSGTATPLAAVAGAKFQGGRPDSHLTQGRSAEYELHHHSASVSSLTPPSSADPTSRPPSQHLQEVSARPSRTGSESLSRPENPFEEEPMPHEPRMRERSVEDVQVVSHVKYSGDFKLSLTAEILLDYPMDSFVGIPLKLNITGMTFDGVAILAHIKKRAHFCFLSPEDGDALMGDSITASDDANLGDGSLPMTSRPKIGGLLEEIRVESEIGQKENGKQVLKNVGKVEKFVLEQVRRIFEEEFVYPSFWTFLV